MDKKIVLLGIDLAKSSFQLHGLNHASQCVFKRKLTKTKLMEFVATLSKCTIVMEACGGVHYFARKFKELGHEAKLIAPQYVKPFVKSNKNDMADAEAITEAAGRPNIHFVPIKQVWQQDLQSIHRIRKRLVRNKTALMNEIRGLIYEYGIVIPKGESALKRKLYEILSSDNEQITELTKTLMQDLFSELIGLNEKIKEYDQRIDQTAKKDEMCQRLSKIRGLGPKSVTALSIALGDPTVYKNGRSFSAWMGLVPKHTGTGGKNRIQGISKRGDSYLRALLVHGARSVVWAVRCKAAKANSNLDNLEKWIFRLDMDKGSNKASVALANKNARVAWALIAHGKNYNNNLTVMDNSNKIAV